MLGVLTAPRTYRHLHPAHHVHPARRRKQWKCKLTSTCTLSQPEPSAASTADLWDRLNREKGVNQIISYWRSKQIITSNSGSSKLAKQLRFSNDDATSIDEYPEVYVNMVERDTGKHLASDP